jgi:hypothetical protein
MSINLRATLLGLMAVALVIGMMGAVYAKADTGIQPYCSPGPGSRLDFQIKDQNESWRDNVSATWTASNMAPGNSYSFDGAFVGLQSNSQGGIGITCDYSARKLSSSLPARPDVLSIQMPDRMARDLVITRALYKNSLWQIDLLTGQPSGMSARDKRSYMERRNILWKFQDADRDGRITFFDLKHSPLINLPLPADRDTRYTMSVGFASTAGNELQGVTFNLTMLYNLTQW